MMSEQPLKLFLACACGGAYYLCVAHDAKEALAKLNMPCPDHSSIVQEVHAGEVYQLKHDGTFPFEMFRLEEVNR